MLVKIPKIRFKLTEKERNFSWNSGQIFLHQQTRQCQSKQANNRSRQFESIINSEICIEILKHIT